MISICLLCVWKKGRKRRKRAFFFQFKSCHQQQTLLLHATIVNIAVVGERKISQFSSDKKFRQNSGRSDGITKVIFTIILYAVFALENLLSIFWRMMQIEHKRWPYILVYPIDELGTRLLINIGEIEVEQNRIYLVKKVLIKCW